MRNYEIMRILSEILENRIESNNDRNKFDKKFIEIEIIDNSQIMKSDEIEIYINEEYSIIKLLIMIEDENERFDYISIFEKDNEESKEDEEIYINILRLNIMMIDSYEYINKIIINSINQLLLDRYNIKI